MREHTPEEEKELRETFRNDLDRAIAIIDALNTAAESTTGHIEERNLYILLCEVAASLQQAHDAADRLGLI